MEFLCDFLVQEITFYLNPRQAILGLGLTNKNIHQIVMHQYTLSQLLRISLRLKFNCRFSRRKALFFLKNLYKRGPHKELDFEGYATTGGVDQDLKAYWVQSMFKKSRTGYCSRQDTSNIIVAAVLKITQPEQRARRDLADFLNKNPYVRQYVLQWSKQTRIAEQYDNSVIKLWSVCKENLVKHLKKQKKTEKIQEIENLLGFLGKNESQLTFYRKRPDNEFIMEKPINVQSANSGEYIFISNKITVNREGKYSCPVKNFIVLVSDSYIDVQSSQFDIYKNLTNLNQVKNLVFTYNALPGIQRKAKQTGYEFVIFKHSDLPLRPVLWGSFKSTSIKKIQPDLKFFSGVYLYVVLIDSDDRREQINWHHPGLNIDVNFIGLKGMEIPLNYSQQLFILI